MVIRKKAYFMCGAVKHRIGIGVLLAVVSSLWLSCREQSLPEGLQLISNENSQTKRSEGTYLVVVTHGWVEKGKGGWPEDMAVAIHKQVGSEKWVCGYFDWSQGAKTLNATRAAKYARDIGGPRLAREIIRSCKHLRHIHLIAHSCGCWGISEAAKILARETTADIHLTFFDAYIPGFWKESSLGNIGVCGSIDFWVDHYYTRDYTLGWTQQDLTYAHNVDVTGIDKGIKDHNFPWRWYLGTIGDVKGNADVRYGFSRSREAADANGWQTSMKLPRGNKAVKLEKQ